MPALNHTVQCTKPPVRPCGFRNQEAEAELIAPTNASNNPSEDLSFPILSTVSPADSGEDTDTGSNDLEDATATWPLGAPFYILFLVERAHTHTHKDKDRE